MVRDGEAARGEETEGAAADRALMARLQAGDGAALGELMARWERPVKAVIGRLVLNAREAEELAQETFVRVWQQREKYRVGADVRPWIFAIAVNLARNRLRWWRRRPEVALEEWEREEEPSDKDQGTRAQSGAAELEQRERVAAVRAAVAALPLELREALVLFEYEGMAQAEIAAAVGATPKAVEARVARAKEKLRAVLRRWM